MNVLILGPKTRNSAIEAAIIASGHRCEISDALITPERAATFDWLVVNGYAPILKPSTITAVGGRVLNIHPSYLPYGRGIFPLFWAVFHGWKTGVSIHRIDPGIDTGPLFARREISPLGEGETLRTFNARLLEEANQLFVETWPSIASGGLTAAQQEDVSAALVSKNRIQSEAFVELLPLRWETPLRQVSQCGEAFRSNLAFLAHLPRLD